jgi:hypothetical protein
MTRPSANNRSPTAIWRRAEAREALKMEKTRKEMEWARGRLAGGLTDLFLAGRTDFFSLARVYSKYSSTRLLIRCLLSAR